MAALHTTVLGALCTAVDHLTGPRHLGLLLCLPLIAQFTLRGAHVCDLQIEHPMVAANHVTIRLVVLHAQHATAGACSIASLDKVDMERPRNLCCPADGSTDKDEATLMVQLARIHKIATAWRDAAPQELPPTGDAVYMAENLPGTHWLPFTSQVKCVPQCNALLSIWTRTWTSPATPICQHATLPMDHAVCLARRLAYQRVSSKVGPHGFVISYQPVTLLCCDLCRWP